MSAGPSEKIFEGFDVATETKTKELIRPMPVDWWLKKPAYTRFMIRDVTSVFIAGYCVFLLVLMYRAEHSDGDSFRAFYESLGSPLSLVLHLIALAFAAYHSITFFNLTPRVIVVFRGDEKVPESAIAGLHYVGWAVVSLVLILIALVA
jgi:fumarate reductase subunit C